MKDQNSIPARIDSDLDKMIKEIAKKNAISFRQASKEAAKAIKKAKINGDKIIKEIKF